VSEHYDVIIIGTGAGGGTLAYKLAPSGKRILVLERGGYLAREPENWDSKEVFLKGRYLTSERWYDKDGTRFNLYSFAPPNNQGNWKAIAYSEEGEYLLAFTLNARSKAAYEANLPVFVTLIQKYAKDIPW